MAERAKLGWAVVGLGWLGENRIIPALAKSRHAKLAAVVTSKPPRREEWKQSYQLDERHIYHYENFDEIANDDAVDVVYIVLPVGMHHEYVIRAAAAGKHVMCEKPMAVSSNECREMISACKQANVYLGMAYRCQHEPHHREAIRFCREHVFGQVRHIDAAYGFEIGDANQWRLRGNLAGGGALMDVGIYALQACRYLTGEEPVEVFALETKSDMEKFSEVDETITWSMRFPSGITANCMTTYGFEGANHFRVTAEKGSFGLESAFGYSGQTGWTSNPAIPLGCGVTDHFQLQMNGFSQAIMTKGMFAPGGGEGLRDLLAIEAIYRSVQSGKMETVEGA